MITDVPGGAVLDVRVIPRAGRTGLAGTRGGALLVRVAAAPVDGAANDALLVTLAEALQVPRRALTLVSGDRSRSKRIRVAGHSAADLRARLPIDPADAAR